jgi:hypothetical protein
MRKSIYVSFVTEFFYYLNHLYVFAPFTLSGVIILANLFIYLVLYNCIFSKKFVQIRKRNIFIIHENIFIVFSNLNWFI